MQTLRTYSNRAVAIRARCVTHGCLAVALLGLVGYGWDHSICLAQEAADDEQGAQVLTRGPVHEAFAGIVTLNPEPGIVVAKAPPDAIEEIPPGERPEGNNVTWIPGYWAWDDERGDFLWVSGTWRELPPGREWIAGYWGKSTDGYQWTSGYWANAASEETTYLPAPPATVEDGPSTEAPSKDHGWTPGSWIWRQERYAWSPGYWALGRADWDWMPAHYVWTPRGYIYVDGYWDYSVERRGTIFAPVYFNPGLYSRIGYSYSPLIVLNLALFSEHLFLRPNYHHYYFGDYYAPSYHQHGFFAAYDHRSNRHCYDPLFAHQRWEHRHDRQWEKNLAANFKYRRDNENARPPHTWDAMKKIDATNEDSKKNHTKMATSLDQLSKKKDGPVRFQAVDKEDRQILAKRGKEVQKASKLRYELEAKGGDTAALKSGEAAQPIKMKRDKSPIAGKSLSQLKEDKAPPAALRSPTTDPINQNKDAKSVHLPKGDKNYTQLETPKTETESNKLKAAKLDKETRKTEVVPDKFKADKLGKETRKTEVVPDKFKADKQLVPKKVEKQVQLEPQRRIKEVPPQVREQPVQRIQKKENNIQRAIEQPTKSKSSQSGESEDKPGKKDKKDKNR